MNFDELKKHIFIVIGEEHYTPLGVIRSLGENGIKPIFIVLKQNMKIASLSKYIDELYEVDSYLEAIALLKDKFNTKEDEKPFVIPCDDRIASLIDQEYNELRGLFIFPNGGCPGQITNYMNKWTLCELAIKHGLNVAKSWTVNRGEIPEDIVYPIITKPIESYPDWKSDYYICKDNTQLNEAFSKIKKDKIILQQYISKVNELCIDGVVINHGKELFVSIASTYTYILPNYYSMEMIVKNFDDENLYTVFQKMFTEIGFEGIFSAEFMIDSDGKLWFLEINFRDSTWSWASTKLGMNLPILWANGMITGTFPEDKEKEIPSEYIALAEVQDFIYRVKINHMISIPKWITRVFRANCLFYYDKKDIRPCFGYWFQLIKHFITKKKKNNLCIG